MKVFVACLLLVGSCTAYPATQNAEESGLEAAYKFVQGCGDRDMALCLKMRALTLVDKALRRPEDIPLFEGVSLVRTEGSERVLAGRALSEDELENSLPKDAQDKDAQVESLLVDRVARFLQTHTLQLKVPESSIEEVKRSLDEGNFHLVFSIVFQVHQNFE